jgi:ribosomal protein L28
MNDQIEDYITRRQKRAWKPEISVKREYLDTLVQVKQLRINPKALKGSKTE